MSKLSFGLIKILDQIRLLVCYQAIKISIKKKFLLIGMGLDVLFLIGSYNNASRSEDHFGPYGWTNPLLAQAMGLYLLHRLAFC